MLLTLAEFMLLTTLCDGTKKQHHCEILCLITELLQYSTML